MPERSSPENQRVNQQCGHAGKSRTGSATPSLSSGYSHKLEVLTDEVSGKVQEAGLMKLPWAGVL